MLRVVQYCSVTFIARAKDKPYKLADGHGLYLEVMPTGAKLWRLKFRHAGKENRLSFGAFPEVSLKEARERRAEARALLLRGVDPAAQRKAEKRAGVEAAAN
ncbi:MAG: Arm DNA-binding domain-containing protein [Rhodanobacter sp.]|nr:Arm DNA-binding domain-containing protein [Rhodanobacter sp.]